MKDGKPPDAVGIGDGGAVGADGVLPPQPAISSDSTAVVARKEMNRLTIGDMRLLLLLFGASTRNFGLKLF
jgi:hypothetical protein